MLEGQVVPHDEVAGRPVMLVHRIRPVEVGEDVVEEAVALLAGEPLEAPPMLLIDKDEGFAGPRMGPDGRAGHGGVDVVGGDVGDIGEPAGDVLPSAGGVGEEGHLDSGRGACRRPGGRVRAPWALLTKAVGADPSEISKA